ncbi:AMP-binding enzyme family protein [Priestia megaterium]|uniref:AMP-binding enzyme family protein n=1 Tax=Priestia megaterium (strain ATCC 14581 / DSM 32 / CCUG 1817 / JCM 2506 / NBRC 15308 / NCIMB 9376 / NCTC 10342 / NRRL B-14308 / VKM B-512 / Ford 19) TaxID=1348623 RepID=A0A0B6AUI7_PRIM2|nr:AMP-binding enzyme family protein [Priestia megaterium NBRC 15308 = ATCC 14581]KFN00787.1 AMP-binding enzyme family protein [Priestia megaterium]KGJ85999.1 long-chain fatty acid--CoA ligase [Priestia megaterium NBRC 15308 = ATCC 14581]MDR4230185.1 AMP-binding protein [Priestia megaterium]NER41248.1 AMP-binding protein [Priestia megaterium NBRC 15308 = ATCC 14581]
MESTEKIWLSQYPDEIPDRLHYEQKNLAQLFEEAVQKDPKKSAIYFLGKKMTFSQLHQDSLKLSSYLIELGLKRGDRVAIMLPNCPQAVISFYAVLLAGGVVVQTNPLYTERELEYQLNDSEATMIIALDLLYPRVVKMKALTKIKHVVITSIQDYLPFPKNIIYPFIQRKQQKISVDVSHTETTHLFKRIINESSPAVCNAEGISDEDIAILQYTGGTTGFPKGVMLTHKNLVANATMCSHWLYRCRYGEEKVLGIIPFFHVYGLTTVLVLSVLQNYEMVLLPKFDAKTTLKTIHKQQPTLFPGAPTIYIALLNHPDLAKYNLSSIDSCMSGSAPLPVEVQEQFEKLTGGKLVEGYGLTETSPVTHANFLWKERIPGSIGVPWPDTDAKILSFETGKEAAVSEVGEIAVKGPQVMKGYWKQPEETEAVMRDGWLLTGDVGYMDDKGYFYVVDRKKDIIIAGGYNIYPREVEEVLYEHEKIQEAVVVGVPDPYRGETVKAYIVLKNGVRCTEEELNEFSRKYLAAYKVPRLYEFRNELPKTAVGKILRRALIDEENEKHKKAT